MVEVFRPYRRKNEQTYWDISLPDGSRAFLPENWTETTEKPPLANSNELNVSTLLTLAKIVVELQDRFSQKGARCDEQSFMDPIPGRKPAAAGFIVGRSQPEILIQSDGEPI
jgi:hypothetical protein